MEMPEGRGQRSPLDQLLANMIGEPIEGIQPGLFIPHGARDITGAHPLPSLACRCCTWAEVA